MIEGSVKFKFVLRPNFIVILINAIITMTVKRKFIEQ